MIVKLDEKDRKILLELCADSRQGTTAIAKKVGLARENTDYRIKRLEHIGVIREYNTYFDESKLGLRRFVFLVQLINLHGDKENDIMNFLHKHRGTTWIGPSAGKWSIVFDVVIKQNQKVTDVMKDFFTKYQANIGNYISFTVEDSRNYIYKLFGGREFQNPKAKHSKKYVLDSIDWKILGILNDDARTSYAELSIKTRMTANAIKGRIKSMQDAGIICGYTISVDIRKLGFEWYTLNLNLAKFGDETEKKLKSFFREHKGVAFYCRDNGVWEYDVGLYAKNSGELRIFINELRTKFPDEIKITDVFITLEETKGYKLPDGVFEE